MTRRTLIAGNWKLNKTVSESLELVRELGRLVSQAQDCDIVVAPPYTSLYPVAKELEHTRIEVAAQEVFYEDSGAYTGTVSAKMVAAAGCTYAIVAHSERRQLFGETLESSGKRVAATLRAGLTPIFCVGEVLEEREANKTLDVVARQLDAGVHGLDSEALARVVVAYEPVWAIGTGKVATPAQAQEVHAMIRERIHARDSRVAETMRILYGGSMKPDNAAELLAQPDIDGGLVGGASLDANNFAAIIEARPGR